MQIFDNLYGILEKVSRWMFPKQTIDKIAGGKAALSQEMIRAIELWGSMLRGTAPWITDDVKSLRTESGIVCELANTCLLEIVSSVSNPRLDEVYHKAIRDLNENLQDGLALGSFIIKPLGEDGAVEYVTADRFIPLRFDYQSRPVEIIFVDVRRIGSEKWAIRLEHHDLSGGVLHITNRAYYSSNGVQLGREAELGIVPDWAHLAEDISYKGAGRPVFGYFRCPVKNRIDDSHCGISIYEKAAELIRDADEQYGRLIWEMRGGELAVHVDPSAINPKKHGVDSLSRRLYRLVDAEPAAGKGLFEVFSPQLRDASILNGLNAILRRIEFAVGLAYGDLSDIQEVAKTATEIRISKSRKFQTVKAIEDNLKDCLDDLVYALAFWMGLTKSGYEFICEFHDSVLTDDEAWNTDMREDVAAGILRPEKYVARKYGIPEDQLTEWIPGASAPPAE